MDADDYQWNSPDILPPVDCPILIKGNFKYSHILVERTTHLTDRSQEMVYRMLAEDRRPRLVNGDELTVRGRFFWSYP